MKRCTALNIASLRVLRYDIQPRRWNSYDSASLTKDALLKKVEAGLGEDKDGKQLKIDTEAKTISTVSGDLPISPLFDPAWMKARRQQRKLEPGPPTGRFQRKLANNPYARALISPLRKCENTRVTIPRYFLQDFELVKHPETGMAWWAPGPLSFEFLQPTKRPDGREPASPPMEESEFHQKMTTSTSDGVANAGAGASEKRPRRGPITGYALSRKEIVDIMSGPNRKYSAMMASVRTGMAMTEATRDAVWRQDMGDVLLGMMRRQAVDALITRANKQFEPKDRFLQACTSWDEIKNVKLRGCILWLPKRTKTKEKEEGGAQYATFDVEDVKYGGKMAVHNLYWLLGEEEVQRLQETAPLFRDNELLVLKQWPSISMMRLHMLLWRLQGYLPEPSSTPDRENDEL